MTAERPNIAKTSRYPIGKAAEILQVSRPTLLRWVEKRLVKCSYARGSHRKVFSGADLIQLWEQSI